MDTNQFKELLDKYVMETITASEAQKLFQMLDMQHYETELHAYIDEYFYNEEISVATTPEVRTRIQQKLSQTINGTMNGARVHRMSPMSRWKRLIAAASIIGLLVTGYWFFINEKESVKSPIGQEKSKNDIDPGKFRAKVKLANGEVIIIDSVKAGELAKQGSTIVLNKDGQLVYQVAKTSDGLEGIGEVYNTVSTNNGEDYSFTLPDGSRVWLNSASSVHFPVAFSGKERRIEITGEVYIKVAKNPAQPFIASAGGVDVLALGTEFNINAYNDEEGISATLIEGSVKVSSTGKDNGKDQVVRLQPGQQTQRSGGKLSAAREVNIEEITGWKKGFFHFESADLKTILRQYARWYDIEVIYEGQVSSERYFTITSRNTSLSNVLKSLQDNNIKFRIQGKKLFVEKG